MFKSLEKFIKDLMKQEGWDIVYNLSVKREKVPTIIDSGIDNYTWKISVVLHPDFENIVEYINRSEKLGIKNSAEKVAYSVLKHEKGHWEYCPIDILYLEAILDGVSKGLKSLNYTDEEIKKYSFYVANMFADIIDNTNIALKRKDEDFLYGRLLLYTLRSYSNDKKISTYYGIFIDTQTKLYLHLVTDKSFFNKFIQDYEIVNRESEEIVKILLGEYLSKKVINNDLTDKDRRNVLVVLNDRKTWRKKAQNFAEIIGKYIKDENKEELENLLPLSTIFKKAKENENFRRMLIQQGIESGSDFLYSDKFEVFDEIYNQKSDEIVLEFLEKKEESYQLPLYYMRYKKIDNEKDFKRMKWSKTRFIEKKNETDIWLYKKEMPYIIEQDGLVENRRNVDLLFIIDVSGSMGWNGIPLDGSKYDMCLRAIWAIIKYLEKVGKAPYLNYGLILFSNTTEWSGWKSYTELNSLKKMLFEGYQNGNTNLDVDKLEEAYSTRRDEFLSIMITDGEIENSSKVKETFRNIIEKGNDVVLFQIMSNSNFAKDMKNLGAIVIYVQKPEDLVGLAIRKVEEKYSVS